MNKLYIIRKFIMATSLEEARKKDKRSNPDEIYLEESYIKNWTDKQLETMGFKTQTEK